MLHGFLVPPHFLHLAAIYLFSFISGEELKAVMLTLGEVMNICHLYLSQTCCFNRARAYVSLKTNLLHGMPSQSSSLLWSAPSFFFNSHSRSFNRNSGVPLSHLAAPRLGPASQGSARHPCQLSQNQSICRLFCSFFTFFLNTTPSICTVGPSFYIWTIMLRSFNQS